MSDPKVVADKIEGLEAGNARLQILKVANELLRAENAQLRLERDELLAALRRIEGMADKYSPMDALGDVYEAADVARTAIAKAEGR
jgi:hypothetical protein